MSKQVQDAYIVAATRSAVGKAPRGMFKNVRPDDLLAHVLKAALAQCAGLDPHAIDDVITGCAMPEAVVNVPSLVLVLNTADSAAIREVGVCSTTFPRAVSSPDLMLIST